MLNGIAEEISVLVNFLQPIGCPTTPVRIRNFRFENFWKMYRSRKRIPLPLPRIFNYAFMIDADFPQSCLNRLSELKSYSAHADNSSGFCRGTSAPHPVRNKHKILDCLTVHVNEKMNYPGKFSVHDQMREGPFMSLIRPAFLAAATGFMNFWLNGMRVAIRD